MKIIENENEIILTDTPIFFWIFGSVLSFVCLILFVFFIHYVYQNPNKFFAFYFSNIPSDSFSALFNFGMILLCFVFLFVLFFSMVLVTKITIKVNRLEKFLEIRRNGLLKNKVDRYFFSQISRFETVTRPKDGFTQLVLLLGNDSKINLEIGNLGKEEFSKTLAKLNSFIIQ